MKHCCTLFLLSVILSFFSEKIVAQQGSYHAVDDSICVMEGDNFLLDVKLNDSFPSSLPVFVIFSQDPCFQTTPDGFVRFKPGATGCCGEHILSYFYEGCQQPPNKCTAKVKIIVKCPKPDCFLVNLDDLANNPSDPNGGVGGSSCAYACEFSGATYYVSYDSTSTYSWAVTGGVVAPGANPAEIMVSWGAAGSGTITLTLTNANNETTVTVFCVDILEGPVAAFTPSALCVCLNGPISFANNSLGGNNFFWDFGDGNSSNMFAPTHQYSGPGTYTVTLIVTKNNYDEHGNPLCCCADTAMVDIMIDSLPGPNIYCISTLCAGDNSCYWTDASNCATYTWNVLDADGNPLTFSGQGTDSICVQWGDGPFGTMTLDVSGCDSMYCPKPTSFTIPIISDTVAIAGPIEVCENEPATYTVPKWLSVYYDWQVSNGVILSGQGTNTVVIQWGPAPGPGIIHIDYYSTFLGGLPGHEPEDCAGVADLLVDIKPAFELFGPNPPVVCVNSTSSFIATAAPSSAYTWTITPAASFTGQGSNSIAVTWDGGPGIFTVTAMPNDTTAYCNDKLTRVILVMEVLPPDSITGPLEVCPGESYTYFGHSSQSGTAFNWTIVGGTPANATGNPVSVTWNPVGPYVLILQQSSLNPPFCLSDTIQLNVTPKLLNGPLSLSGSGACINSISTYTAAPGQHPDAVYQWTVSPASAGSVVGGQGTSSAMIQWNNTPGAATVQLSVKLCNDSLSASLPVTLLAPVVPVITQTGILCPGMSAILNAGAGFINYAWSTGDTTQTISISTGGIYVVTTTDMNGCTAVDSYTATALPGPVASISTGDPTLLCINPPNNNKVKIVALTGTGYTFTWFCNGTPQSLPPTQNMFTHMNTNVEATFNYWVKVTDSNGCMNTSNVITVVQDSCPPPEEPCNPESYTLSFTAMNLMPNCNFVKFNVSSSSNVILTGWTFGDPGSNSYTGPINMPTHEYTRAGCTRARVYALVPAQAPDTGYCEVIRTRQVCIPLVADFSFTDSCSKVSFTDQSTFLTGDNPTMWMWDFGDSNTSTQQNPMHTYAAGGSYTVSLIATNVNGCQDTVVKTVTIQGPPTPTLSVMPSPACTGEPLMFMASASNILSWFWDFDDGSNNGAQNPKHTYLNAGNYTISLTVVDIRGCLNTVTLPLTVFPAVPADTISYSPGLSVCAGDSVMLTAPSGTGYTYVWAPGGATTQSIFATQAGTYFVTVTDANGCTMTPDSVTITILPLPSAAIAGNPVICDSGCTILSAPVGQGYTYQWLDPVNPIVPLETGQTLTVCDNNLLGGYAVVVTDANGCSAVSGTVVVSVAISPSFSVTVAPDSCEGSPVILSVTPVQPNVVYQWSTGATGTSITVIQAGLYTVVGTDTLSGCRSSASATVHPLPDLCIVPAGCYEACNPDTICGPDDLAAYQWNLNGVPISGATGQCLIVTQSGTYSLTGTTAFGCELTSDSLMLTLINCQCDEQLNITAEPSETDSCCWTLSYENLYGDLFGLVMHTDDAEFLIDLNSIDPALTVYSIGDTLVGLVSADPTQPLPDSLLENFITICLENTTQSPQQIIIDWYDFEFQIVCSDTLELDCPVEPDCLYLQTDSIYCDGEQVVYTFTVCNPVDADFPIAYIILEPDSPVGIVVAPSVFDETSNPILPGGCRTYTVTLSGPNISDSLFCFHLIAHNQHPELADTTLCCMLDTVYCIRIPDCLPCDNVGVEHVETVSSEAGECCYAITLYNSFAAGFFDGIDLCMLSGGTTMTIVNPFGSGWFTASYSPTMISLNSMPPLGVNIPLGAVQLPLICISTNQAPSQLLEIKWMDGDRVVCRDTIELGCEPPCGYMTDEIIECDPATGAWVYSGLLKNTSLFTMGEAHIVFTSPAGMNVYNQTIPLGALPPGGTQPFNLVLGSPALPGDTVCFTVSLHAIDDDSLHVQCCNFYDCIVLPECILGLSCSCNESFEAEVNRGILYQKLVSAPYTAQFRLAGNLSTCDKVQWYWTDSPVVDQTIGLQPLVHTFPKQGAYSVCAVVERQTPDGNSCNVQTCTDITFEQWIESELVTIYPNPSRGSFLLDVKTLSEAPVKIRFLNLPGQLLQDWTIAHHQGHIQLPIEMDWLQPGVYWMEVRSADKKVVKKVIIQ